MTARSTPASTPAQSPETGPQTSLDTCPDCGRGECDGRDCYWPDEAGIRRPDVAPFGMVPCLNCGRDFFPGHPHQQFCADTCASQYASELGL